MSVEDALSQFDDSPEEFLATLRGEPAGEAIPAVPSDHGISDEEALDISRAVRRTARLKDADKPGDDHIIQSIRAFVGAFNGWYLKVIQDAVENYRTKLIQRINPFVRRVELSGLSASVVAARLVDDYNARNFATAGGWALEGLAECISDRVTKSSSPGIDLQRHDPDTNTYYLYVVKSGTQTQNADIRSQWKQNLREAEKLLRQSKTTMSVVGSYVIAAGRTASTFEDGFRRPSSAEFWAEITGLSEGQALDLVLGIAEHSGARVRRDTSAHLEALRTLVAEYMAAPDSTDVDWEFVVRRTMLPRAHWKDDDLDRHRRACAKLANTGYWRRLEVTV